MHTLENAGTIERTDRPGYRPFRVSVAARTTLSPHLVRITFSGEDLHLFGTDGLDQRVKIVMPVDGIPLCDLEAAERGPTDGGGWYDAWRALPDHLRTPFRTYTVRAVRPAAREVDIDFVWHGDGGPAARWLAGAGVGDPAYIVGPDARSIHSGIGIDWHPGGAHNLLLVGDETAAPAICAILEALPSTARGHAYIEVPTAEDALSVEHPAGVTLTWLARGEANHGGALTAALEEWIARNPALIEASRAPRQQALEDVDIDTDILWESPEAAATGELYAWLAGESGVIKTLRRMLVTGSGVDRKRVAFMGYWRHGRAEM